MDKPKGISSATMIASLGPVSLVLRAVSSIVILKTPYHAPRTNNDTERAIRGLKTRYRRISGRKNWNSYILRYGRCVAFYDWWQQEPDRSQQLEQHLKQVTPERWRQLRKETTVAQSEQLKRFRFRHKRATFLASLETRWATAAQSALLP